MQIVIAILALAVGLAIGYLIAAIGANKSKTEIEVLKSRLLESRKTFEEKELQLERMHAHAMEMQRERERDALEALQGRFDETVAKMKAELQNVTSEMLRKRQEEFAASSRIGIAQILEPLNLNLAEMRRAVTENTQTHTQLGGELAANLQLVMRHSDEANRSATRLAEALRHGGKMQGDWGETILTELLERQGLKEGIHFDTQVTMTDEKGRAIISEDTNTGLRPDVVLHLDRERDLIIDSKVSLTAFLDYVNADSEDERALALKRHLASLEKHVKELVQKNYSLHVKAPKKSVNYVIMFVPTSAALFVATNADHELWRRAMEKGVYMADEQTLYAALKIIDMTWRQIAQAENHEKVYQLADEMLDRVARFMEKFNAIGAKLNDAHNAYDEAYKRLKEGGASIPATCNKLRKLGARSDRRPRGVEPELLGFGGQTEDEQLGYPLEEG